MRAISDRHAPSLHEKGVNSTITKISGSKAKSLRPHGGFCVALRENRGADVARERRQFIAANNRRDGVPILPPPAWPNGNVERAGQRPPVLETLRLNAASLILMRRRTGVNCLEFRGSLLRDGRCAVRSSTPRRRQRRVFLTRRMHSLDCQWGLTGPSPHRIGPHQCMHSRPQTHKGKNATSSSFTLYRCGSWRSIACRAGH